MFAKFLGLLIIIAISATPATLFAQASQPNIDLRIIAIEGTEVLPDAAALTERKVVVQIQDISRGPLAGTEVTFTLPPNGDAGSFANGSKTEKVVTDREGLVSVQIRPQKKKFSFRVDAAYQTYRASSVITVGPESSGSSMRKLLIGGLIGAGAVVGAIIATGGEDSSSTGPTITTISVGTPAVGPPQ